MAAQAKRTLEVARYIATLRAKEKAQKNSLQRRGIWVLRWGWMLYHEVLRDNVKIRAESLAYLSLFSLLPLIAGTFFIFTVLAQFGMVQDALHGLLGTFLSSIPSEHREFVNEYVMKFQQSYMSTIHEKSGTIGVFALFILAYVGLQAFSNIENTLNDIWGSDTRRPFLEKARNFIVVAVVAPITLIAGFSIPLILQKVPVTRFVLESIPLLRVFLSLLVPTVLLLGTFLVMYRFVPVARVTWKAAFSGAIFSTVALAITNAILKIYFSFFSNSAYGKLASVPLIAFWLFIVWTIVILGAEVSFLIENEHDLISRADESPTFAEARGVVSVLAVLHQSYIQGNGPVDWEAFLVRCAMGSDSLRKASEFLVKGGWMVEVASKTDDEDTHSFLPAKDLSEVRVASLLADFLSKVELREKSVWAKEWDKSIHAWIESFGKQTIGDLSTKAAGGGRDRS